MVPFLIIFIAFIIILTFQIRKTDRAQEEVERKFWEKENRANSVRKQDISKLDYFTLPMELIPGNLNTLSENALLAMDGVQMLNLTAYTNTDLKLKYGAANLDALSVYENAYVDMISQLTIYCKELIEAKDTKSAKRLLEFAVEHGDDSKGIYLSLARIYKDSGDTDGLDRLLASAEKLDGLGARALVSQLKEF